jgi:hypothetical protein
MYVCPFVPPHGTTRLPLDRFSRNLVFEEFWGKSVQKFKCHYNWTKITGTLREDLCTYMIISRWILRRMRNFSDKS